MMMEWRRWQWSEMKTFRNEPSTKSSLPNAINKENELLFVCPVEFVYFFSVPHPFSLFLISSPFSFHLLFRNFFLLLSRIRSLCNTNTRSTFTARQCLLKLITSAYVIYYILLHNFFFLPFAHSFSFCRLIYSPGFANVFPFFVADQMLIVFAPWLIINYGFLMNLFSLEILFADWTDIQTIIIIALLTIVPTIACFVLIFAIR